MRSFAELLIGLAEDLPLETGDPALGIVVEVTELDLEVPIEAHIGERGALYASLPRGRFAAGLDVPHGRVRFFLKKEES